MAPYFSFMTGAHRYRIQAHSPDEAIRIAFQELNPSEDVKAVIRQTLCDEEDARRFSDPEPNAASSLADE
jgi:hypothetical protein